MVRAALWTNQDVPAMTLESRGGILPLVVLVCVEYRLEAAVLPETGDVVCEKKKDSRIRKCLGSKSFT
jgi:hypothetical protein